MRSQTIKLAAFTSLWLALSFPALAVDTPPIGIQPSDTGAPQPVPPLIDIGVVKPGRPQTLTQPFLNSTNETLVIESAVVDEGDFSSSFLLAQGGTIPPGGTFTIAVTANAAVSGPATGSLEIQLASGLVWDIDLFAQVDVVDASVPELSVAQTGLEAGSTAPFGAPLMYPAPPVSAAAALVGSLGVAIPHTASTTPSYLHVFFPDARALARTEFRFDPNSLEIPNATPETIAGYYDYGLPTAWLEIRRFRTSFYQLRVAARLDNGSTGASDWVTVADGPLPLVFDWWAGSPGVYEGGVRVRCGVGCATEFRSTGLNFPRIRNARVGAVSGVSTAAVGNAYLDELRLSY
ncbi:MAG: hypothetical protein SF066_01825 [Thermoanaerobaculia bacterium]|nr:hypothetical protein [Thermoanaerobaculia bacterium]